MATNHPVAMDTGQVATSGPSNASPEPIPSMKPEEVLHLKEKLASLIKEHAVDILKSDHFRSEFQTRVQPLFDRIKSLEDENRRLKITLEFLRTELKSVTSRNLAKKTSNSEKGIQVDELHFLPEKEPEDKSMEKNISSSLKRTFDSMFPNQTSDVPAKIQATQGVLVPMSAVNSVNSKNQVVSQLLLPNSQQMYLITKNSPGVNGMVNNVVNPGVNPVRVNGTQQYFLTTATPATNGPAAWNGTTPTNAANSNQVKAPTILMNSSGVINNKVPVKHTAYVSKQPVVPKVVPKPPAKTKELTVIAPKPSTTVLQNQVSRSLGSIGNSTTSSNHSVVSSSSKTKNEKDEEEIMEVEAPRPKTPEVVELLSDDEDDVITNPAVLEIQEFLAECLNMHPKEAPSLPFAVTPEILPLPKLSVRHGFSRDNKKAVILRMEAAVNTTKITGVLQYRIFSYLQTLNDKSEERRWKQLTVIKVQCGKICECTLTQLMVGMRYHFVVCLVNGNNRSPFSNCATTIF